MATARVYLDEDVHGLLADALRLRGRTVLTTVEAGKQGSTDQEQIRFATEIGYVFVSYNVLDFPRLHHELRQAGHNHPGIIVGTQDNPSRNVRALLALIDTFSADDFANQLLYLNNWLS